MIRIVSPSVFTYAQLTKPDFHSFQIVDFALVHRVNAAHSMQNPNRQGNVRTVSACSRIAKALLVVAEFESQVFIVLFNNPPCNLFQGRSNLEGFWTGWIELYVLVAPHEFKFEAHLSHCLADGRVLRPNFPTDLISLHQLAQTIVC